MICTALGLTGCGASARDQVEAKIQQLAQAAAAHDYGTICDQVLAPALVAHFTRNEISCQAAMRVALGTVRDPVISIGSVVIRGRQASVITLTAARGQAASLANIELVQTASGWRIASLGSSLARSAISR